MPSITRQLPAIDLSPLQPLTDTQELRSKLSQESLTHVAMILNKIAERDARRYRASRSTVELVMVV